MSAPDLVGHDLPVEQQNEKLRRIVAALMNRVEKDIDESGNAFTLFQRAIALEAEVAARTADLQRTLDELNAVNARLEEATMAAEAASRAKSRFLAAASHDLLQPLNAAKLFIASLGAAGLDADGRRVLDRLASAFRSVEEILGALLDISRLDSEATRATPVAFPLARIFEPIGNEFQHIADASGTRLTVMPTTAHVRSDPFYLRQVVQNLVSNAVRYGAGGRVLVGARRIGGGRLRIEVHDTGPGIAPEDVPLVFAEFKRLDAAPGPGGAQGVGLGLAIVERACKLLGHPLDLASRPGRGTCFSVTAPLAAETVHPAAGEVATESSETMIALVVAAEPGLAARLAGLIEGWGMAALTAADAGDAAEQIALLGLLPDVLILDEAVAAEALEAVRAAAPGRTLPETLRVVRLADGGTDGGGEGGAAAAPPGSVRVLRKPIRPHQLRAAVG